MYWRSPRPGRSMAAPAPSTCCSAGCPNQRPGLAGTPSLCKSRQLARSKPLPKQPRLRIELAAQAAGGAAGEAQGQSAPPGGGERGCGTVAQQGCAERVRHHEATFFGDQKGRKVVRHREIKPVRKVSISG